MIASGDILSFPIVPRHPLVGLAVVGFGASLAPLDFAVNIAFPAITQAFTLETSAIRWVAISYVLTYASLMLAFGRLGDVIGHRHVFRAGLLTAVVAFVMCALAPTYGWLLAARVVQGVSVALVLSCAPALAISLYDESRRTWALGAYAGTAAAAGVVAPLIGGISVAVLGWAGVFWFRAPIALLALLLLPLLPEAPRASQSGSARSFDLAGAVLLAAGLALLMLAPAIVQSVSAAWHALAVAAAGIILFGVFVQRQRNAAAPMLRRSVVRDVDFWLPNLANFTVHVTSFAIPLVVPYYLTRIAGWGPMQSGLLMAVWATGALAGSALAARVVDALGVRPATLAAGVLVATGQLWIALWPDLPSLPVMLASLLLQGAGLGLFQVAYTDIVVAALPRNDRGVAGSLTMLTRTIGIVLGAVWVTASMHAVEARELAAGAAPREAFLAAFQTTFGLAAALAGAFFALTCLRRSAWFARRT